MNVLIVSQCHKNALNRTRRIVDQFAERRGERTWQTAITWQGLDTLRCLLKKTARKNTAVACHWIRGKDHTELLWIVGNASHFNDQGAVPTNSTERDILRTKDENDWHHAEEIQLLSAIAALFHDLGKSNRAFQKKLKSKKPIADALRHEWVSLRLLEAFVGSDDDHAWLARLADLPEQPDLGWIAAVLKDGEGEALPSPLNALPPLARIIGWLIVSHHRLPANWGGDEPSIKALNRLPKGIYETWCGARLDPGEKAIADCWQFDHAVPFSSPVWQTRARKQARKMLECNRLFDDDWLTSNTYVLHMARLILMLADHHYSSLSDPKTRISGTPDYPLVANTRRDTKNALRYPNQPLDEHLIGVEKHTGRITYTLPRLARQLPSLARHKGFKQRSPNPLFRWQDKAYDAASSLRERSVQQGFFGINMASTGCGKTLGNGRIMYALADPARGARFSIALGLRTLTLQTGDAYRQKLGLGADDLAVLVGGSAVRALHEHNRDQPDGPNDQGSESAQPLLPENSYVHYDGCIEAGPLSAWLADTRGATALIDAPILTCTIDHLVPATESTRGGRQIAPMLRLMSADLVLDEPDDFELEDLPALTRLVHWVGLLGSRLLLSSATLPPSLIQGLFEAYRAGREIYQVNRGIPGQPVNICTAWFDEFSTKTGEHATVEAFMTQHKQWVTKRVEELTRKNEQRRIACIVPLPLSTGQKGEERVSAVAGILNTNVQDLHSRHHSIDPDSGKQVSFGLIRMANIRPLVDVTRALAALPVKPDHRLHLCCYHSQHPLLVRSNIEKRLDHLLNRQNPDRIFTDPELGAILNRYPEGNHVFIVLATAVAEVGRDHDYDWAIVEPSSMRSIIQLAGRVRRHRPGRCQTPNIHLLDTNLKHLEYGQGTPAYCKPGFEDKNFPLDSHRLTDLLTLEQIERIDATPRITERPELHPRNNLVDLEHDHLRAVMLGDSGPKNRTLAVHHWWKTHAHLSGELQRRQPFRNDPQGRAVYALLYDEENETVTFSRIERDGSIVPVSNLLHDLRLDCAEGVSCWGEMSYMVQVEHLSREMGIDPAEGARRFGTVELPERGCEQGWDYHPVLGLRRHL